MQLTRHTDYGLRVLIYLQVNSAPATVRQIAEAYGISTHHLAKVAQHLTELEWITSKRGRHGGLEFNEGSESVTVGQVVRELENNLQVVECFGENSNCCIEPACKLKYAIHKATLAFLEVLDGYQLKDIARNSRRLMALLSSEASD